MEEQLVAVLLADQVLQDRVALQRVTLPRVELFNEGEIDPLILLEVRMKRPGMPS
jgi:hypothetical protein